MQVFTKLIEDLLATDDLPRGGKQIALSKHNQMASTAFPENSFDGCCSINSRVILLASKHIKTTAELTLVAPKLRQLAVRVNKDVTNEGKFYDKLKRAFPLTVREQEGWREIERTMLSRSPEMIREAQEKAIAVLEKKLANPIQIEHSRIKEIIENVANNPDVHTTGRLGVALQLSCCLRSIDLISSDVAKFEEKDGNVIVNGHSKRSRRMIKQTPSIQPRVLATTCMRSDQFLTALAMYRERIRPIIEEALKNGKKKIDGIHGGEIDKQIAKNKIVSVAVNGLLSAEVKRLFPEQAAQHGRSGSHLCRSLGAAFSSAQQPGVSVELTRKRLLDHGAYGAGAYYACAHIVKSPREEDEGDEGEEGEGDDEEEEEEEKRPAKKKQCVRNDDDDDFTELICFRRKDGSLSTSFEKFKRLGSITDDELKRRVGLVEDFMKKENITITHKAIRRCGIGADAVNRFRTVYE